MASWVEQAFDARAAHYDDSAMHRELAGSIARFAEPDPGERILDVATGTGLVLRALPRPPFDTERMAGVDLSAGMLTVAARHLPGADLHRADIAALPFADGSFDLLTGVAVLPYLPDATAALREWRRCTTAAGRVVIAAFASHWLTGETLRAEAAAAEGLVVEDPNEPWGSLPALDAFAVSAGLHVTRSRRWTVEVEPVTADSLLGTRYPFPVRDDLLTATEGRIRAVRRRLDALVRQQHKWTTTALLVEMRAASSIDVRRSRPDWSQDQHPYFTRTWPQHR